MPEPTCVIALPSGMSATILPFGATLHSLRVPDRAGVAGEVLVGQPEPAQRRDARSFHGATIGRFANRIREARFTLDGTTYDLSANESPNLLHGGADGFDQRDWEVIAQSDTAVTLRLHSPAGDQGFPGTLDLTAEFALHAPGTLSLTYRARASESCPVSITSHGYFNLNGGGDISGHELEIAAPHYLPIDAQTLPAGAPQPVAGTAFDFRTPRPVLREGEPGFDHCFCFAPEDTQGDRAVLYDPTSGREMRLRSNHPGVQFYTTPSSLCLEPQHWPDAPNRPDFPDATLRPGEDYTHRIEMIFSTRPQ
ncbi:galactose mutarotase [Thioclava sp. BHET1]|nr:galactose mutarotase [Thioclava sp. BHET1]